MNQNLNKKRIIYLLHKFDDSDLESKKKGPNKWVVFSHDPVDDTIFMFEYQKRSIEDHERILSDRCKWKVIQPFLTHKEWQKKIENGYDHILRIWISTDGPNTKWKLDKVVKKGTIENLVIDDITAGLLKYYNKRQNLKSDSLPF